MYLLLFSRPEVGNYAQRSELHIFPPGGRELREIGKNGYERISSYELTSAPALVGSCP